MSPNLERPTSRSASAHAFQRLRFGLNSKRAHPPLPPRGCAASSAAPANSKRARFKFALEVWAGMVPSWQDRPSRSVGTATNQDRVCCAWPVLGTPPNAPRYAVGERAPPRRTNLRRGRPVGPGGVSARLGQGAGHGWPS